MKVANILATLFHFSSVLLYEKSTKVQFLKKWTNIHSWIMDFALC